MGRRWSLCPISATNRVQILIRLLDDPSPIVYSPPMRLGQAWRICDRAAVTTSSILLGWENLLAPIYIPQEQRDETMKRVKNCAKQAQ